MKTILSLTILLILASIAPADLSWECPNPYPNACVPEIEPSAECIIPHQPPSAWLVMPCPVLVQFMEISDEDADTLRLDPSPTIQSMLAFRDQFLPEQN